MKKKIIATIIIFYTTTFLWSESIIKLKEQDYKIVAIQDSYSVIRIEILNKKILSRLITENDFIIMFSVNEILFKAKGMTIIQSAVPDNCDYVFFTNINKEIFIIDNEIILQKRSSFW